MGVFLKSAAIAGTVVGLALGGAQTASAMSHNLDFVAEAAGNERGVADGTTLTFDGLDVTFTSSHFAYFDDVSGGPGGLGVCQTLTNPGAQCDPSNDDNLGAGEDVTLTFGTAIDDLGGFVFHDANHESLESSLGVLTISGNFDGGGFSLTTTFMLLWGASLSDFFAGLDGITDVTFSFEDTQYYISGVTATSPVPLPMTAFLLLGALGGLGYAGRRRRKAA